MSKMISNNEMFASLSASLIPSLVEIRDALVKQIIPDRELVQKSIATLEGYLSNYEEMLHVATEGSLFITDVDEKASKAVLKNLLASEECMSALSNIGRMLLVDENSLSSYSEKDIRFLVENGLITQISLFSTKDIVKWTVTTRGWEAINSSVSPDYCIPTKNEFLPGMWTVKAYRRIGALTSYMANEDPYLVAFVDEEKTIPYACRITDVEDSKPRIIISLVDGIDAKEEKQIENAFKEAQEYSVGCLCDDLTPNSTSVISDRMNDSNWKFIDLTREEISNG